MIRALRFATSLAIPLCVAHCSSTTRARSEVEEDAAPRDAGVTEDVPVPAEAKAPPGPCTGTADGGTPRFHRSSPETCPLGQWGLTFPDAGPCDAGAGCTGIYPFAYCTQGACTQNECYEDSDCAPGTVCVCGGAFVEGVTTANTCVHAECATDADCRPGTYCVASDPAGRAACGAFMGYYCSSPEDTCVWPPTDCPCSYDGGYAACSYDPEVGHFVCAYESDCYAG